MNDKFFRALYRIRKVEEEIANVYPTDKIKSPVHLSIGQEAVSVGVCEALQKEDIVFGTYRGHALYLAKGGDLKKMIAELYGKATGCAKGKGGSMHLVDVKAGMMGTSAIVGTTISQAVGYALAAKLLDKKIAVVSVFGDGAYEEGVFHESLNFASLKKLPVIFVCENNRYAIHSHQKTRQPLSAIYKQARSYGIESAKIEGNDVFAIYQKIKKAVQEIRQKNSGPKFFECMTYRFKEHVGPKEDYNAGYRAKSEAEKWMKNDPVLTLGSIIKKNKKAEIELEVEKEIKEAFEFAEKSPFPDPKELYSDVFASA